MVPRMKYLGLAFVGLLACKSQALTPDAGGPLVGAGIYCPIEPSCIAGGVPTIGRDLAKADGGEQVVSAGLGQVGFQTSDGGTVASTGIIRLKPTFTMFIRNSSNTGDNRIMYDDINSLYIGNLTDGTSETYLQGYFGVTFTTAYNDNLVISDGMQFAPAGTVTLFLAPSTTTISSPFVNYLTSTGNGVYTANLNIPQTTNATPATQTFALPSNTSGTVVVIGGGKVPGVATSAMATWTGLVTNNAGTCAIATTGAGAFTSSNVGSTGTVAGSPFVAALSGCNILVTVTGVAATTFNWSGTVQYISSGGS